MQTAVARGSGICVLVAALGAPIAGADVLSQLGIPVQAAREAVSTIINNGLVNPGLPAAAFKLLTPAARGEAATAAVAWLKAYTASPEFTQQYAQIRTTRKPDAPVFPGTPEDELKKQDDEQKAAAEETKKALASLPPEQRAQIEQAMKDAAAFMATLNTPEQRQMRLDGIKMSREERARQYQQEVATWQRDFPETPNAAIAKRLREFLALTTDIDFAAQLKPENGRMAFVNPAYEAKSAQWKQCYRAGKEATAAARTAVQAWLKEL